MGEPGDERGAGDKGTGVPLNLLGTHRHALDDKRRVAVPKAFREAVEAAGQGEGYVVCRSLGGDACLALYTVSGFQAALAKLEGMRDEVLGVGTKDVRAYLRKVHMSATTAVLDRQGRITLRDDQCQLAGIDREVVFVGVGGSAEIWAPERLDADDQDFGSLAQRIFA